MPDTRNLFHPENLKIDRQLQKKANPVSSMAETTLFQLAAGGDIVDELDDLAAGDAEEAAESAAALLADDRRHCERLVLE